MRKRSFLLVVLAGLLGLQGCESQPGGGAADASIRDMLSQVSESQIHATASDLQGFVTRRLESQGNLDAGTYIRSRFAAIPGLTVEYQGGELRNVIATLPGTDASSQKIYVAGAHYDCTSDTPGYAPGATDNACGVGILLELASIMSKYRFKNTLKFAAWNSEESGLAGSRAFVSEALLTNQDIEFYVNFDSAGYDPEGRLILDVMFNDASASVAETMKQRNSDYGLGFMITSNVHACGSDYRAFWEAGLKAVMTHAESHGPAHTAEDTVDKISTVYAKKNGQLGMAILAELAGLTAAR